jgi:hypothetical protein
MTWITLNGKWFSFHSGRADKFLYKHAVSRDGQILLWFQSLHPEAPDIHKTMLQFSIVYVIDLVSRMFLLVLEEITDFYSTPETLDMLG